ncbi:GNAT family N-acetyltransferase [Paralimibaculum aggregatum]|nr:GNAT family N-acetyltransferase [Limibaculum sp. NKW23]
MSPTPTFQLNTYNLTAAPATREAVPLLHELSIGVGWPHRPEDWEVVIDLGTGVIARDEIGRVVGSALCTTRLDRLAHIGMVITTPKLQELGAGRWMMEHVLEIAGDRLKVLNATRAAYRLYIALGFIPQGQVHQHNGKVTACPAAPAPAKGAIREMTPDDHAAVHALDTAAFGAARPMVIDRILPVSTGTVLEREGRVAGFALCRRFGRGHVVGPIVAEDDNAAVALTAPHVRAHVGSFLRVDTRQPDGDFRAFLLAAGISHFDTVTRMTRDGTLPETGPAITYALINQALG